eukprot:gene16205-22041_t
MVITVLVLLFSLLIEFSTCEPKSLATNSKQMINKPIIAAMTGIGLILGKKQLDGPVFLENVPMSGKVAIVTGANTGLGKVTAAKLAELGCTTVLLCKSKMKGDNAITEITKSTSISNKNLNTFVCDLSSLESVYNCVNQIKKTFSKIDILVNNAGVMALPDRTYTKDGFEAHIGINHLGHFALTGLLIDLMNK